MHIIGLTGSIGSGKSTVAQTWEELGASIIDADLLARTAVLPGTNALKKICEVFSDGILNSDGTLNRKALGAIVFKDANMRAKLEAIIHPEVRKLHQSELDRLAQKNPPLIVAVIPLLFENIRDYSHLQKKVLVISTKEQCISRIVARDGCTRELAEQKIQAQMSDEDKRRLADVIIENNGTITELKDQARNVYLQLILR